MRLNRLSVVLKSSVARWNDEKANAAAAVVVVVCVVRWCHEVTRRRVSSVHLEQELEHFIGEKSERRRREHLNATRA